jgi:DNA-binding NtrC family response regulator
MKAGADDYLTKPFSLAELEHRVGGMLDRSRLADERDYLRSEMAENNNLVGSSPAFEGVKRLIAQAGPSGVSVLVLGETGSGKEGVARALHEASPRRGRPFIAVNCSAFASSLIESELFGHERGAFTGAQALRKGRIELADSGTLFLDEVGDLPAETQVKLLRAIEQKSFERVGGSSTLKSDFRLISATHRDLKAMAAEGRFRDDLYFRLAVFPLQLPPLRERGDDVVALAEYFLRKKAPGRKLRLGAEAEALLKGYRWPGNVRELQNVVERAALLSPGEILRLDLAMDSGGDPKNAAERTPMNSGKNLAELMDDAEKRLVEEALSRAEKNQSRAAKLLGIERSTLQYKIKKFKLSLCLALLLPGLSWSANGRLAKASAELESARRSLRAEAGAEELQGESGWWNLVERRRREMRLRRLRMLRMRIEQLEQEIDALKKP